MSSSRKSSQEAEVQFKVVSMNVLAPCYRKLTETGTDGVETAYLEKDRPEQYMARNEEIIKQLVDSKADVICLQEFWSSNEGLQNLYVEKLCDEEDYTMKTLPRTSHWRKRDDGLAVFVKEERVFIQDYRDILFHDVGDRVAQMLLLAMRPEASWDYDEEEEEDGHDEDEDDEDDDMPLQQFICVNTHLLFPHNEYSSKIRMREATKILGFVESYRQRELCATVCSRSSVRVPTIITGDFNGRPSGQVYNVISSQNYRSVFDREEYRSLVTHMSHRNEAINVDHVFYQNPSDQTEDRLDLVPVPDWTNLVFRELKEKIIAAYGMGNFYEAFRSFDSDGTDYVSKEEFSRAILNLGFGSEGQPALTSEEIAVLVDSADKDGNGQIDFKEFCWRFWMADNNLDEVDGGGDDDDEDGDKDSDIGEDVKGKADSGQQAKSTWLVESVSVDGEEGGKRGGSDDNKWGDSGAVVVDSSKSRKGSKIIFFESDDAPGIWGEFSTELGAAQKRIQGLPDSVPLGDLRVVGHAVTPDELSSGVWPQGYSISDHGMVEVTFKGTCLNKEE
jgi:mRNA deadenylase 3'-5' endonuclease subunit Ccr4